MNTLALKSILAHLTEAHGELARLFARIRFIVFGEVKDETVKGWAETVMQDERTSPLDERTLFVSLARAYRHLNVAWNGRHASKERVRRGDPVDFNGWSRFPEEAAFRDLWPAPSRCRGTPREPGRGHIMPNSLQAAFLQMAVRKLGNLRYIISFSLGDKKVPRPKGLRPGIETEPFTEAEFVWRMHRIYSEMNFAWAYRKGGEDLSRQAIRRRRQFPGVFLAANASSAVLSRASKPEDRP